MKPLICLLFFLSGCTALVYEVCWMRQLVLALGVTAEATACIISVFLGGLAAGAYLGGKVAPKLPINGLTAYGAVEIAIGLSAAAASSLTPQVSPFVASLSETVLANSVLLMGARIAICCALLLIPTTLMGASLPFLVSYFVSHGLKSKSFFADLYGLNTLGGAFGSLLTCYLGMPALGLLGTTLSAAFINVSIGVFAILASKAGGVSACVRAAEATLPLTPISASTDNDTDTDTDTDTESNSESNSNSTSVASFDHQNIGADKRLLFLLAFMSGFCAIGYELLWTRMLRFSTTSSTYAFSVILCVFLIGLALGSLLFKKWMAKSELTLSELFVKFAHLQFFTAIFCAASLLCIPMSFLLRIWVPELLGAYLPFQLLHSAQLVITAALFILIPSIFVGVSFPMVTSVALEIAKDDSAAVGNSYALNTLGCVLGSALVGLLLIPTFGTYNSFQTIVLLTVISGVISYGASDKPSRSKLAFSALGPLCAFAFFFVHLPMDSYLKGVNLLRFGDDIAGSVMVLQMPDCKQLIMNGAGYSSTIMRGRRYMRALGELPVFLNPNAKDGCVICFGVGSTAGSLSLFPQISSEDIVELSPLVIRFGGLFADTNYYVLNNHKVNVSIADGRNFLLLSKKKFDLLTLEPPPPAEAGVSNLYSREFYALVKSKLNPGGVLCQWAPMHTPTGKLWKMMVRAAQSEFSDVSLWETNNSECILVCKNEPLKIDLAFIEKQLQNESVRQSLFDVGLGDTASILACFVCSDQALRKYTSDVPEITDDRAQIEFFLPYTDRRLYNFDVEDIATPVADVIDGGNLPVGFKKARESMRLMRLASKENLHGQKARAAELLRKAQDLAPGNKFFEYSKKESALVLD